mmetsp:Transcript_94881/g.142138  ORF Transcript_94881/g.142138 Transcript_94881/m.142138 type:complete len:129 (+) Transcript_94881:32-418(+)
MEGKKTKDKQREEAAAQLEQFYEERKQKIEQSKRQRELHKTVEDSTSGNLWKQVAFLISEDNSDIKQRERMREIIFSLAQANFEFSSSESSMTQFTFPSSAPLEFSPPKLPRSRSKSPKKILTKTTKT